jgi:DNA repair photolyase
MNPYLNTFKLLRSSSKTFIKSSVGNYGRKIGMMMKKEFGEGDEGYLEEISTAADEVDNSLGSVDEIIDFLKQNRKDYEIIYVSGDTDSFAPPRADEALDLLYRIATEIRCDLLFTTRATFSEENYQKLEQIVNEQRKANKMLYACVSITRISSDSAHLESPPTPLPEERMNVLRRFKEIGATTVLAMRPFLPIVKVSDYIEIIDKTKQFVDIALGEAFYFIRGGKVESRVFPNGILEEYEKDITKKEMTFDDNKAIWDVWESADYQQKVQDKCKELGIIFSMHSDNAIVEFQTKNKK